jgi:hypothetical protein
MKVTVTARTVDLLVQAGAGRRHAVPRPDGRYDIEMSDETKARVEEQAYPSESIDDTLQRLVLFKLIGGRLN